MGSNRLTTVGSEPLRRLGRRPTAAVQRNCRLDLSQAPIQVRQRLPDLLLALRVADGRSLLLQVALRQLQGLSQALPHRILPGLQATPGPLVLPLGQPLLKTILGIDQRLSSITHRPTGLLAATGSPLS